MTIWAKLWSNITPGRGVEVQDSKVSVQIQPVDHSAVLLSVQKTVAAINLPISVVDLSGHLTYINPACAQFFM